VNARSIIPAYPPSYYAPVPGHDALPCLAASLDPARGGPAGSARVFDGATAMPTRRLRPAFVQTLTAAFHRRIRRDTAKESP
jgi:hypothetical protein